MDLVEKEDNMNVAASSKVEKNTSEYGNQFTFKNIIGKRRLACLTLILSVLLAMGLMPRAEVLAAPVLTVMPITWNVIGLDSNNVNSGPDLFPVGVRVCNTGDLTATGVLTTFVWDSANVYVNLNSGSINPVAVSSLARGQCSDVYFEVRITRTPAAYTTARRYHIEVSAAALAAVSTPAPREIYVERLISQNRNDVLDLQINGVSIGVGGTMNLVVGNTYTITLLSNTATNGYEQIETFLNFPNQMFRIISTTTTYSANDGTDPLAGSKLYADGCGWVNLPTVANYRACTSTGKYGGRITTTYRVEVIGGAGTTSSLTALIYDYSGSSYHYNSDFPSFPLLITPPITDTPTNTVTVTSTETPTATFTATPSQTSTTTATATLTNTPSLTPTATFTRTPTDTATNTATGTVSVTPTNTPTSTETGTPTDTPSVTPTGSLTITPTDTLTATTTFTATVTDTGTVTNTVTYTPTVTGSVTPGDPSTSTPTMTTTPSDERHPKTKTPTPTVTAWMFTGPGIPVTGFKANTSTDLSAVKRVYYAVTSIRLEIPALKVNAEIVGVPLTVSGWDVTWLNDQAGWLEGSAFPSWSGNSVVVGHLYLANGKPGPFAKLDELKTRDQIIVHAFGQKSIYEVLTNAIVSPSDKTVVQHEDSPWLTLVTCTEYDPVHETYRKRFIVRAVLVKVEVDK